MKRIALIVAALLFAGCTSAPQPSDSYSIARATVRLLDIPGVGNGSGVVIAPGKLLTAGHVAEEIPNGLLAEPGKHPVTLVKKGEVDVAIVAADVQCPCARIASYEARPDEEVIVVGYPHYTSVGVQVLTHGAAQGISSAQLQMTAPVSGGNSGGGVFVWRDGEWQLVGILIATHGAPIEGSMGQLGVGIPYLSVAIPLGPIHQLLQVADAVQ